MIVSGWGEEIEDVLYVLVRVVHDLATVVESWVNVVGLDHVAHQILGLLGHCVWASSVLVTKEETKWGRIDRGQVIQISLFLAQWNPVVV